MSLITDIDTIVKAVNQDATFRLNSYFRASRNSFKLKDCQMPLVVLDNQIVKECEIRKNSNITAQAQLQIYFLDQDRPNNTDLVREEIRQSMENLAHRVFLRIFQLSYVTVEDDINPLYTLDPVFNALVKDLTGVLGSMNINENVIKNWC